MNKDIKAHNQENIILYQTEEGNVNVSVVFEDETFWLTQKAMGVLFDVEIPTINYDLAEIYKSEVVDETATIRKIRIVQREGNRDVRRDPLFYNLDAIIAVGYRVSSNKGHRGLATWKNALNGKILKSDVTVSKNYLCLEELSGLNYIVNIYSDYAENQAKRSKLMSMSD